MTQNQNKPQQKEQIINQIRGQQRIPYKGSEAFRSTEPENQAQDSSEQPLLQHYCQKLEEIIN